MGKAVDLYANALARDGGLGLAGIGDRVKNARATSLRAVRLYRPFGWNID